MSGKNRNWREEKVNLQNNPASTLSWEDVKQKCAPAMGANLVVAPEAELDLTEAYIWYEARRVGLGEEFLGSVDACLERILASRGASPSFTNRTGEP